MQNRSRFSVLRRIAWSNIGPQRTGTVGFLGHSTVELPSAWEYYARPLIRGLLRVYIPQQGEYYAFAMTSTKDVCLEHLSAYSKVSSANLQL